MAHLQVNDLIEIQDTVFIVAGPKIEACNFEMKDHDAMGINISLVFLESLLYFRNDLKTFCEGTSKKMIIDPGCIEIYKCLNFQVLMLPGFLVHFLQSFDLLFQPVFLAYNKQCIQ